MTLEKMRLIVEAMQAHMDGGSCALAEPEVQEWWKALCTAAELGARVASMPANCSLMRRDKPDKPWGLRIWKGNAFNSQMAHVYRDFYGASPEEVFDIAATVPVDKRDKRDKSPSESTRQDPSIPFIPFIPGDATEAETISGCSMCTMVGDSGPRHQPSPRCQSGGRPHCSCDICF